MQPTIDTLTVRAPAHDDVQADKADLLVTIRGSSLVTGSAALKKAREVSQLVADLAAIGIGEDAITLMSVRAETATNVIGKSSSASYQLRVRCAKLDMLPEVLGVITGQKNTQLTALTWGYPDLAPIQDRLLQQALSRGAAKARIIAQALDSRIVRVHAVTETLSDEEAAQPRFDRAAVPMEMSRARLTADDLGLAVTHSKRMTVHVEVVYHIVPV